MAKSIVRKSRSAIRRGRLMRDSLTLGLVAGLIGVSAMTLSNHLLYRMKKTEIRYANIAGSIIMKPYKTHLPKNFMLGQIIHWINGGTIGVLMVQFLKKFGTDFLTLKGALAGIFAWEMLYTVGQRIGIFTARPHLTKTGYAALWNNLVYGIVTAHAIRRLAHPSVFRHSGRPAARPETERQDNYSVREPFSGHQPDKTMNEILH